LLDQIEAALNLYDRFKKSFGSSHAQEGIADRFIKVFEAHGVNRNQIPRFFDHQLLVKDVQNANVLLEKLTEPILKDVCELFTINRTWLDGSNTQVHPINDFYKNPQDFSIFLDQVINSAPDNWLIGELYTPEKDLTFNTQSFFVIYENVGFIENEPIYKHHLCSNFAHAYWKSRADLAACMAIAYKKKVYIKGLSVKSSKHLNQLASGEVLLPGRHGLESLKILATCYPEDLVLEPEVFLKDVDPETNNFGIKSALGRWLEYAELGLMDTGYKFQESKEKFKNKLLEF
jgi:hypothetical protein